MAEDPANTFPPASAESGVMLVISSPSGAGKTTLTKRLLAANPSLRLSVSATTRAPRAGEVEGVDYHFWTNDQFETAVSAGEFLEHAQVFDHRYGTPAEPVRRSLITGHDVVFDIDWQGAAQVRKHPIGRLTSVFILPPSFAALERRLRDRAADPGDVIARRMARAVDEISHWAEYEFVVLNDDLDAATAGLQAILDALRAGADTAQARRYRREVQIDLPDFVTQLMHEA